MTERDLDFIGLLIEKGMKPNKNQKKELFELATEIGRRESKNLGQVAENAGILPVLNNPTLSSPDKLKRIKSLLYERRYPEYSATKKAFSDEIKKLNLASGIKLSHTPYFEDNKIRVEFTFKTPDELQSTIDSLKKLSKVDVIKNALENK